jgi:sarcosine oxidase gamma subunit
MATFSYPNFSLAFNNVTVYTPNSWGMTNYVEIDNIPPDNVISVTASSGLVCITSTLTDYQTAIDNSLFRPSISNFKTTTGSIFIIAMLSVPAEGATESANVSLIIANNTYSASYTVTCSNVKSQFKFNKVTNATPGNDVTSNIITLTGLVAGDEIRANGGYFNISLNGDLFSTNPTLTIGSNGSASVALKSTYANLVQNKGNSVSLSFYRNGVSIGQVSDYWDMDTTPIAGITDFTNVTNAEVNTEYTDSIQVSNFPVGNTLTVTATGGKIKTGNFDWNDSIRVTVDGSAGFSLNAKVITGSAENETTVFTVTIGTIKKSWTVTTKTSTAISGSSTVTTPTTPVFVPDSSDNTKESFGFVDQNDVLTSYIATSNVIKVTGFTVGKPLEVSTIETNANFSVSVDGSAWSSFTKHYPVYNHNGNLYLQATLKASASFDDSIGMNVVIKEDWGVGHVNSKTYSSRIWRVTTTKPASTGGTGTSTQEITQYDNVTTNHNATDLTLVINSTTNVFGGEVFSPLQRLTGFLPNTPVDFIGYGCEVTIMPEELDRTYSPSLSSQANSYGNRFFRLRTITPSTVSGQTSKTVTASYSFTDKNDNNYYKTGNITWNISLSTSATTTGSVTSVVTTGTTPSITIPTITELTYSSNFILNVSSKNNVELNTEVLSDIIKIIGLPTSGQIKITTTGGEVAISSSSSSLSSNFKSENTFVITGDVYVQFKSTSGTTYSKTTTVNIGFEITSGSSSKTSGSALWVVSTKSNSTIQTGSNNNTPIFTVYEEPEIDSEPDGLQFVDVVDANTSEIIESEQITVTDLTPDQWIQVHTGGVTTGSKIKAATTVAGLSSAPWVNQYNVKISSSGSIAVAAKLTSSNSIGETVSTTIFVGKADTTWNVTTTKTLVSTSDQQESTSSDVSNTGGGGGGGGGTVGSLSLDKAPPMVIPIRPFVGNELAVLKAQYAATVNNGGGYLTEYSTHLGKYLFSKDVLIEFGYLKAGSTDFKMENWTAMNGFRNYRAFIAAGDFQEFLFDSLMAKRAAQLEAENIKISEMSVLSAAGLLMCAVRYGVPVVKTFASTLAGSNTGTGTGTGTSTSSESGEVTTTETKLAHGGSAIMDNNKCYITVIFQEISIDFTNSNSNVELFITNFDQVKTTSYNVDSGNKVFPKDAVTRHITIYARTIGTTTPLPIKVTYSDTTYSDTTHFVVTVINSETGTAIATTVNNSQQTSRILSVNGSINDTVTGNDSRYYKIDLTAGTTYEFTCSSTDALNKMDSMLYLTNASGSELTFNDDYLNAVRDSQITYKVPTSGTYYLKVTNVASNPTSGNFTISAKTKQSTASATITKWKQVACGHANTIAIKEADNTLWTWGNNIVGQLGVVTTSEAQLSPIQIGDKKWKQVACGEGHVMAIKDDNTLWAWGSNVFGVLGVNTTATNQLSPIQIGEDRDWKQVACGTYHTLAIKEDNTLWAWGYKTSGQLGVVTTSISPIQVGDKKWKQVAGGTNHTLAIKDDNTLWAWGNNTVGQLGVVTTSNDQLSPIQVGDKKWKQVACGTKHTLAIKDDNTLWAWGKNDEGQLGVVTTAEKQTSPIQVGDVGDRNQ